MNDPKVLYEDNHLIAVYKPAGVLIQGDKSGDISLLDEVKAYIKRVHDKPGNVFLGLIHRLDRNVDGVVLFAKTSKGASRLSEQFRTHSVTKVYHAWVHGVVEPQYATLTHFLLHDENQNKASVYDSPHAYALEAKLSYKRVRVDGEYSLLEINLGTGRHHQIRAQLSHMGYPIVGDTKYGSSIKLPSQKVALTATSLSFETATGNEKKTVSIEMPGKTW